MKKKKKKKEPGFLARFLMRMIYERGSRVSLANKLAQLAKRQSNEHLVYNFDWLFNDFFFFSFFFLISKTVEDSRRDIKKWGREGKKFGR